MTIKYRKHRPSPVNWMCPDTGCYSHQKKKIIKKKAHLDFHKIKCKYSQQKTSATLLLENTAAASQLCLVWSISVIRELQGKSPRRWRWYKYSSTCRLMLRTSGSRSSSWPNLSECPGWFCCVYSIRALFTLSWVCSTCLRLWTDFTSGAGRILPSTYNIYMFTQLNNQKR